MIYLNVKVIAIAVVAVIVVAGAAIYFVGNNNDVDEKINVIGRVNTDGSGIYVVDGTKNADKMAVIVETVEEPTQPHLGESGKWVVFDKEAWGGKIIATPGPATIQHVQLKQIVDTMGLKFTQYVNGTSISNDTVYYIGGIGNYERFVTERLNVDVDGAIMWEPQYSVALIKGCVGVAITNDLFPGHTCCVVAASHEYTSGHQDETVRFMAAYVESVTKMKNAIEAGSGEEYEGVMAVAMQKVAMTGLTDAEKREAIEDAFKLVVYTYGDDSSADDPLSQLKKDMAEVANKMYQSGQVSKTIADMGFNDQTYGEALVDSSFLKKALTYEKQSSYNNAKVTVAVIKGDVHQLAIHYGIAMGIFSEYGISIELSEQAGGPAVFTAISNGSAQFGFIGAPPLTINSINKGIITP